MQNLPPFPTNDLDDWAKKLYEYLMDQQSSEEILTTPKPVLLQHKLGTAAKAIVDGVMMFDPAQQRPVYSHGGQWNTFDVGSSFAYSVTGNGSVASDINSTDYTGQDGAVGACAQTPVGASVSFYHKGVQYAYAGPRPASYGAGCANTMLPEYLSPIGVTKFTELSDTPASFAGHAGKAAVVNGTETALEFTALAEPTPVVIVEADTAAGWQVWGDTLVQWGSLTLDAAGSTITLPQAFEGTNYRASALRISSTIPTAYVTDTRTASSFFLRGYEVAPSPGWIPAATEWIAIGEAPDALKKPKTILAAGDGTLQTLQVQLDALAARIVELESGPPHGGENKP